MCQYGYFPSLKGVYHEIFDLFFGMIQNHRGPCRILFLYCRDIQFCKKLRGVQCAFHRSVNLCSVHHTPETISAVRITSRRQSSWCVSHRRENLRFVHHTVSSISAVCITPRSQLYQISPEFRHNISKTPRYASLPRDNLRDVHHTAETKCTTRSKNQTLRLSLVAFKVTISEKSF